MYNGFEFIVGLVDAMTDENPAERPAIENVILRFSYIQDSLREASASAQGVRWNECMHVFTTRKL